ncbi:cullin-1 [Anaeramoeba flamelloides]|uniref:Cullin-1 n=1 Tax=Anaeramoeba flamelloides TaxID=1746091 RepID=A0ABQ8XF02_9EUKA|nr:cullin-1 [Anaeramoeba flamelloides]
MSRKAIDINKTWPKVENAITSIMNSLNTGLSGEAWMKTYTMVYDLCMRGSNKPQRSSRRRNRGAEVSGKPVYEKLQDFLQRRVKSLFKKCADKIDEPLLQSFTNEWNNYVTAARFIKFLFSYLDRHFIPRMISSQQGKYYDVYTLHLVIFHKIMYLPLKNKIINAVLRFISNERNGEHVDRSLLKKTTEIFVSLGHTKQPNEGSLEIYQKDFEKQFYKETDIFYERESNKFLSEINVSEYMIKAEARIDEELARVNHYLHHSTEKSLLKKCVEVLVTRRLQLLWREFEQLVKDDKTEDLQRMYKLLNRIENGLQPLVETLEKHILAKGLEKLTEVKTTASKNPRIYVETILGVYQKYYDVVQNSFRKHPDFVKALDKACRRFINKNAVTDLSKTSSTSPELVARFCDVLLKKSSKNPEETELVNTLDKIMVVFKYLEDKDVFQKFYSKMLAKRLIYKTSVSEDAEGTMIGKLKAACGYEWSSKLQRMFTDITVSREMNETFKNHIVQKSIKLEIDFEVMVLAIGFWPLSVPNTKFVLPSLLENCVLRFRKFYNEHHNGRKLSWLNQLSRGELNSKFKNKRYIFLVSTYQMGVLLMFNEQAEIKFEEMQQHLQLSPEFLEGVLATLIKTKVLRAKGKVHQPGNTYKINSRYSSERARVQLNISMAIQKKQESNVTHRQIEEERKMLIQAAIVRIMKARKTSDHKTLMTEVISQLTSRFRPNIKTIKKCIDLLIDKEYLERADGKNNVYNYLA